MIGACTNSNADAADAQVLIDKIIDGIRQMQALPSPPAELKVGNTAYDVLKKWPDKEFEKGISTIDHIYGIPVVVHPYLPPNGYALVDAKGKILQFGYIE